MQKIQEIATALPDDLGYKELSIPMETDREYARADSVEMILTNPNLYLKIINWD